jgi:pimeloyl-ACP methyl ester carboxylesterase
MATDTTLTGYKLPIDPSRRRGSVAHGFVTPKHDRTVQIQSIPPKRVLPIVFIPGIMGSNLRMNAERQRQLGLKNNIAWRPDNLMVTIAQSNDTPAERQARLDPRTTEVDIYDPVTNPTGDANENSDQRNSKAQVKFVYSPIKNIDGPLLQSDPPGTPSGKTQNQRACERGWGEIYYDSYEEILATCELRLNTAFAYGSMDLYLSKFVADIMPSKWQAEPRPVLHALDEKTIRNTVSGCWFPVHAMGYNWLRSNLESGVVIARRIKSLIKKYQELGFQCEKVILITHSMGGLVARAAIHPEMGKLNEEVLGVIHGVMPAMGAATAYKRVRCGFEGSDTGAKVLGYVGSDVTPVLANSQGGLELLPSKAYGDHWLQVHHKGKILKSLPENGDPYEEIYKKRGKWYGLLREDWINPGRARLPGFRNTCGLLDNAKDFHSAIAETYHSNSYAHYGADPKKKAWQKVVWKIEDSEEIETNNIESLAIMSDNAKGNMHLALPIPSFATKSIPVQFAIELQDAADPGDQTVPVHSADAQLKSGKFKGIFRQSGYEHQASYSNSAVLSATLYSVLQIASTMKWRNS